MFTQRLSLSNQDGRTVSATQLHKLGSVMETPDGRCFRYASAGATNLAAGLANVTPAKVANHTNNSVATAAPVGQRFVNITLAGNTATTLGQYDGGYLEVNDAAGVGSAYLIAGTPVITGSGTGIIQLAEGVATALTTSSKVTLVPPVWGNTIVHPGSSAAFFCNGVANVAVTATNFYWSQTSGMTSVLSDGIIAKGVGAILTSNATAGALFTEAAGTLSQRVGTAPEATVDTKYYSVFMGLE